MRIITVKWISKLIGRFILLAQNLKFDRAYNLYFLDALPKSSEERRAYAGLVKLKDFPYILSISPQGEIHAHNYKIDYNASMTWQETFEKSIKDRLKKKFFFPESLAKPFQAELRYMEDAHNLLMTVPHIANDIKYFKKHREKNPIQTLTLSNDDRRRWQKQCRLLSQGWKVRNYQVVYNHNKFILDSLCLTPPCYDSINNYPQSFLLNFNGNNENFTESIPELVDIARATSHTVIGFNYHGVGYSNRNNYKKDYVYSFDELIQDGIAQVNYLLNKGIAPHQITLLGHSLGGGVAAQVAAHFHRAGTKIFIIHSRSFSKLSSVIKYTVDQIFLGHTSSAERSSSISHEGTSKEVMKSLKPKHSVVSRIIAWIAKKSGWDTDVLSAWKVIDDNYKVYFYAKDDAIIHRDVSLHKALKVLKQKQTVASGSVPVPSSHSNGQKFIAVSSEFTDPHNANLIELRHPNNTQNALEWLSEWLEKKTYLQRECEKHANDEATRPMPVAQEGGKALSEQDAVITANP